MQPGSGWTVIAVLLAACGTVAGRVDPDETSAAGHRAEAERERTAARAASFDPIAPDLARRSPEDPAPTAESVRGLASPAAAAHRQHARAHEEAADELERFEAKECQGIPAAARAGCPLLGPVLELREVPAGVRVLLAADAPVDALVRRMRCHQAFARARGFSPEAATCPLDLRGIRITRVPASTAIDILGSTPSLVSQIRRSARVQASAP